VAPAATLRQRLDEPGVAKHGEVLQHSPARQLTDARSELAGRLARVIREALEQAPTGRIAERARDPVDSVGPFSRHR
jgi:hypothetical protein